MATLIHMPFDEAVEIAKKATPGRGVQFADTWSGWVSNGQLHVISQSPMATKDVWHFVITRSAGGRIVFNDSATRAFAYTIPPPRNELERIIYAISPLARIDVVESIDVTMCAGGSSTLFTAIDSDGTLAYLEEVRGRNTHGCAQGAYVYQVTGGTYAIQWETGDVTLKRVVMTPQANQDVLTKILTAVPITNPLVPTSNLPWNDEFLIPLLEVALLRLRGQLTDDQVGRLHELCDAWYAYIADWLQTAFTPQALEPEQSASLAAIVQGYFAAFSGDVWEATSYLAESGTFYQYEGVLFIASHTPAAGEAVQLVELTRSTVVPMFRYLLDKHRLAVAHGENELSEQLFDIAIPLEDPLSLKPGEEFQAIQPSTGLVVDWHSDGETSGVEVIGGPPDQRYVWLWMPDEVPPLIVWRLT